VHHVHAIELRRRPAAAPRSPPRRLRRCMLAKEGATPSCACLSGEIRRGRCDLPGPPGEVGATPRQGNITLGKAAVQPVEGPAGLVARVAITRPVATRSAAVRARAPPAGATRSARGQVPRSRRGPHPARAQTLATADTSQAAAKTRSEHPIMPRSLKNGPFRNDHPPHEGGRSRTIRSPKCHQYLVAARS